MVRRRGEGGAAVRGGVEGGELWSGGGAAGVCGEVRRLRKVWVRSVRGVAAGCAEGAEGAKGCGGCGEEVVMEDVGRWSTCTPARRSLRARCA